MSSANKVVRYPLPSCGSSRPGPGFQKRRNKGPLMALLIHFLHICCRHVMGSQLLGPFLDPGEFSFIGTTEQLESVEVSYSGISKPLLTITRYIIPMHKIFPAAK